MFSGETGSFVSLLKLMYTRSMQDRNEKIDMKAYTLSDLVSIIKFADMYQVLGNSLLRILEWIFN